MKVGFQAGQLKIIEEAVHMRHLMERQSEIPEKLKNESVCPIDWMQVVPPPPVPSGQFCQLARGYAGARPLAGHRQRAYPRRAGGKR